MEIIGPNRIGYYRTQSLPAFGLILPGLGARLNATGFVYYANMDREVASGGVSQVFQDRDVAFFRRGDLNGVSGDATPVLVCSLTSGDFALGAAERRRFYRLQLRDEVSGDPTRRELWPPFQLEVVREV